MLGIPEIRPKVLGIPEIRLKILGIPEIRPKIPEIRGTSSKRVIGLRIHDWPLRKNL